MNPLDLKSSACILNFCVTTQKGIVQWVLVLQWRHRIVWHGHRDKSVNCYTAGTFPAGASSSQGTRLPRLCWRLLPVLMPKFLHFCSPNKCQKGTETSQSTLKGLEYHIPWPNTLWVKTFTNWKQQIQYGCYTARLIKLVVSSTQIPSFRDPATCELFALALYIRSWFN